MLTKRQFASAAGAPEKWVDNTARSLGRSFSRNETEARWLFFVRQISLALDTSLARAADLATCALQFEPQSSPITIAAKPDSSVRVALDIQRLHSQFAVNLAAALLDGPKHRGPAPRRPSRHRTRPSILRAASASGIDVTRLFGLASRTPAQRLVPLGDRVPSVLRHLSRPCPRYVVTGDVAAVARGAPHAEPRIEVSYPAAVAPAALASLIATWDPRPLGAPPDVWFIADEQTVATSPILALETRFGTVVLRRLDQNQFAALADSSDVLDLGGVRTLVLRVPALVAAIRHSRLAAAPATAIPGLEAAAVALNRIDLRP